jgi:arylsulfatase
MWLSGKVESIPVPYYGLEEVYFLGGNGPGAYGDYVRWVEKGEPRWRELLSPEGKKVIGEGPERIWRSELPFELHYSSWAAACCLEFLRKRAKDGRPFFLWCSIPDPHPPYTAPAPWFNVYVPADMPPSVKREGELDSLPPHYRQLYERGLMTAGRILPTNVPEEQIQRVKAVVCAMISQVDSAVGQVVQTLKELELRRNTVIVFTADHGQMLGDHWMLNMPPTHLDGTLRVPCIWSWPGEFQEGLVSEALVSHLDLAPTLLDLAGVAPLEGRVPPEPEAPNAPPALPGRSLVPLLKGETDHVQECVIAENDEDYLGLRMRTVVTQRYHLTIYAGQPYGELYDLYNDPGQLYNLWDDPKYRGIKRDLQALLLERLVATDSALPRRLCHA